MNSGTVARGLYLLLSLAPAAHQLLYLPWHSLVSRAPCCPHNVSVRASGYLTLLGGEGTAIILQGPFCPFPFNLTHFELKNG